MKRSDLIRSLAIAVLLAFVLCIPGAYAKYIKQDTLRINVKTVNVPIPEIVFLTFKPSTNLTNDQYVKTAAAEQTITIKKSGFYLIIAKGGDGGNGLVATGSNTKDPVLGGTGGLVSIRVKLEKGDNLKAFIGHKGGTAYQTYGGILVGQVGNSGYAGTTGAKFGNGGLGGSGSDFSFQDNFSRSVGSGGGGAATVVYLNDSSVYNKNLLCVAAGGGGAGGWNYGYCYPTGTFTSVPSGFGGSGGSNIINAPSPLANKEYIFAGVDGHLGSYLPSSGDKAGKNGGVYVAGVKYDAQIFGGGGTDVGGTAAGQYVYPFSLFTIYSTGKPGTSFDNGGGQGAASSSYAGAGGGGYCGGGSGSGASLIYSAGGGGGGSSYMMNDANLVTSFTDTTKVNAALQEAASLTIKSETHNPKFLLNKSKSLGTTNYENGTTFTIDRIYSGNSLQTEGFVIVKYLGSAT